jgi:hydroxypyruvate isomerase
LPNVLFNMPAGDWARGERGIAALPGREAELKQAVARSLDYARILGTRMLHVMAGIGGDSNTFVSNLRYAARAAAKDGITITIEPLNPHDQPGYFLTRQAQAHAIREEVGELNLKVQMDLYHVQMTEGDITDKIRRYLPHVAHIQIAGAPGRHEPDTGEVNYPHVFRVLDDMGYAGWVGCEYFPRARTEDGLAWMRQI